MQACVRPCLSSLQGDRLREQLDAATNQLRVSYDILDKTEQSINALKHAVLKVCRKHGAC